MKRITLELIRKRSEHNEGEIATLEEIALHQENIGKIELIDKTCKDLRILLLQHNLISKIENLGRLKRLEYLNLALNNIEVIENLGGLESLKKLDLTVNFIGDLRGICNLRNNHHLEQLFLTGNPCAYYDGYREYVAATLPQLKELDMAQIERSERIKALQVYARAQDDVVRSYREYRKMREKQIMESREKTSSRKMQENQDDAEQNEKFWSETSQHTPEDRLAIAERFYSQKENQRNQDNSLNVQSTNRTPKLFAPDGRPYNINQPRISFKLCDEDDPCYVFLNVEVYKYLDTSHIVVDVQPNYVRVTIKGKILQLTLPCEISVSESTVKRNSCTGVLVIAMKRLNDLSVLGKPNLEIGGSRTSVKADRKQPMATARNRREFLEIGPPVKEYDFLNISQRKTKKMNNIPAVDCPVFDDSDVPPLE